MQLDFDHPTILKVSFLTAVDLMIAKLFLVDISSSAKLTFEFKNWSPLKSSNNSSVVSWYKLGAAFSTAVRNMVRIFGPGL